MELWDYLHSYLFDTYHAYVVTLEGLRVHHRAAVKVSRYGIMRRPYRHDRGLNIMA